MGANAAQGLGDGSKPVFDIRREVDGEEESWHME
jgi:hypothetical protein